MDKQKVKRQQILEASVRVIAENGYYKSRISNIAKKAGVADGTIYLYFKNKEDLLISLFEDIMGTFAASAQEVTEREETAAAQLGALVRHHFEYLGERPQLALLTQLELRQSQTELRWRISKILEPYLLLIERIAASGMEKDEFKSTLEPKLCRQMIFGTMDQIVTSWVMNGMKENLVDQAVPVFEMLQGAVCKQV
ncbi:TetR/AcrR family transcriptional regulator [Aciduricibacillus chroicocephali]|uniref:TetR/AcrR family transcriptional regulator n=1 Tax=Aciduricibacillus chroicocephali TaxID=3054939 RepID=A0ABY9KT48_9BACI|nr:TetR/AcrR family transcriptional regulator [Bacillaceae bacterium 44XB]